MPSWTIRLLERSSRLDLAALFPPQPQQGGLVVAHDHPGVGAADKGRGRSDVNADIYDLLVCIGQPGFGSPGGRVASGKSRP